MVEVVFHKVVFGEVGQVRMLDAGEVGDLEKTDIHSDAEWREVVCRC